MCQCRKTNRLYFNTRLYFSKYTSTSHFKNILTIHACYDQQLQYTLYAISPSYTAHTTSLEVSLYTIQYLHSLQEYLGTPLQWGFFIKHVKEAALFHLCRYKCSNYVIRNRIAGHSNLVIYRVYQKEVNSFKKCLKLKSMKVMVNILFYLHSLIACLPPGTKSLVYDNQ